MGLHAAPYTGMMPGMTARHLHLGMLGENAAVRHLETLGYRIAARNWRPPGPQSHLELDVIAWQREWLVFVEVKTRTRQGALDVPAYAAFTPRKQARMVRAAQSYLAAHDLWSAPCRFDLVCVTVTPASAVQNGAPAAPETADGNMILEHHTHVIELRQTLGHSHASWQPW